MKKMIKANILIVILLLLTVNVWALPMAGDKVNMNSKWGWDRNHYGMKILKSADASSKGTFFNTFCLEKNEYFADYNYHRDGGPYKVDSVGTIAYGGGIGGQVDTNGDGNINHLDGDPISQASLWLYASFSDGKFEDTSALKVQEAIWYAEDEGTEYLGSYDYLVDKYAVAINGVYDFTVTGWNIKVVNLVDWNDNSKLRQSQLVGEVAPVPEPATMFLFGLGLLGLAGISRKRKA